MVNHAATANNASMKCAYDSGIGAAEQYSAENLRYACAAAINGDGVHHIDVKCGVWARR